MDGLWPYGEMSTTATLNRADGYTTSSRMNTPKTGDLRPFEITEWEPVPIQSRRKLPIPSPLELQNAKSNRPPLSLKTSPHHNASRSPNYETTPERQPHSAYTYNTFPSISPKFTREGERRNSPWTVPRRAYIPPNIPRDDPNQRCNILFASNLPMETSEAELEAIFSSQPGYTRMSLRATANGPSCFVEFDDFTSAARALRSLYGWPLKHSRTGGIRLSFSKDHLGMPPPPRPMTPRTRRRAPPPPPLVLPVRADPRAPGGFASAGSRRPVAVSESPGSSIEVRSVSSESVEESATTMSEDKLSEGKPSAGIKTEPPSDPQGGQGGTHGNMDMYTVRGPDYNVDTFDEWRLWLDKAVEMELDWYPLPPIKQTLRLSQSRLVWMYNGHPMSIYLSEDETQRCSGYLEDSRENPATSKLTVRHESSAIAYFRRAKAVVGAWARIYDASWRLSQYERSHQSDSASHANDTTGRFKSHLCLEEYPTPTQDATLLTVGCLEDMEDDFEFFVQARRMLCRADGSWMRQLLPWSYHEVRFSKFRYSPDGSNKVQTIDEPGSSDPRDDWGEYEINRLHGQDIDIHMRMCAHMLLQGIRYPEIGRGSRTFLDSVPMLRRPVASERDTMTDGWGFFVRQSLSIPKIVSWTGITMVLGLMLVPFFASLSLVTILFMLFLLRLGGHTEFRL